VPGDSRALAALSERFRIFGEREARGSSRLYESLAASIAEDADLLRLASHSRRGQQAPNLLLAAVHLLVLRERPRELGAYYASLTLDPRPPDERTRGLFREFCRDHERSLLDLLSTGLVQTNEPRRSAALVLGLNQLIPRVDLEELVLIEVGASAGLNLLFPNYAFDFGGGRLAGESAAQVKIECDLRGAYAGSFVNPRIKRKVGIDLNPIRAGDAQGRAWLRALVWPEEQERLDLLTAALAVAGNEPPELVRGDVVEALPRLIGELDDRQALCIFHSATIAHFPDDTRASFDGLLAHIAKDRALFRLSLEGPAPSPGPFPHPKRLQLEGGYHVLGLTTYPWKRRKRRDRVLAAVDGHASWIHWTDEDVALDPR